MGQLRCSYYTKELGNIIFQASCWCINELNICAIANRSISIHKWSMNIVKESRKFKVNFRMSFWSRISMLFETNGGEWHWDVGSNFNNNESNLINEVDNWICCNWISERLFWKSTKLEDLTSVILFWDVIVGNLDVPSSYQEKRGHLSIWDTHVHYAYIMLLVLFYLCFWLLHVFTNYVSLIIQFCPETLISSLLEVTCSLKLHLHEFAQTWF